MKAHRLSELPRIVRDQSKPISEPKIDGANPFVAASRSSTRQSGNDPKRTDPAFHGLGRPADTTPRFHPLLASNRLSDRGAQAQQRTIIRTVDDAPRPTEPRRSVPPNRDFGFENPGNPPPRPFLHSSGRINRWQSEGVWPARSANRRSARGPPALSEHEMPADFSPGIDRVRIPESSRGRLDPQ